MKHRYPCALPALLYLLPSLASADSLTEALKKSQPYLDFRLRYEQVDDDRAAPTDEAKSLTLRSAIGVKTGEVSGFSGQLELKDIRTVAGVDDYSVPPASVRTGQHAVIADPETTELNQAFLQYRNGPLTVKAGRQIINLEGQRFVGAVAWRQDDQNFDALRVQYQFNDKLSMDYAYLGQRNRIFADASDQDAKDHLLTVGYKTPIGQVASYAYLLETHNGTRNGIDTYGASLKGKTTVSGLSVPYYAEMAYQDTTTATNQFDTRYFAASVGVERKALGAAIGYEQLGSDNSQFGFSTPLATGHKFNGWSDQFLNTPNAGLKDAYLSLYGPLLKGKWQLDVHDFRADKPAAGQADMGSEIDASYVYGFAKHYQVGAKYAHYEAGAAATGKVDSDRFWLWVGAKF